MVRKLLSLFLVVVFLVLPMAGCGPRRRRNLLSRRLFSRSWRSPPQSRPRRSKLRSWSTSALAIMGPAMT
jgi:hypothetical protein